MIELCEAAESCEDEACSALVVVNCVSLSPDLCAFLCLLAACKIYIKANEESQAVYYTTIKHFGHLMTLEKYRKHSLVARAFYILHGLGFFIC